MHFSSFCKQALFFSKKMTWLLNSKTLLVMRLTALLLFSAALGVSAKTRSQTVTCTARSVKIEKVFASIEQQTGYVFFYRKEDVEKIKPVSIDLVKADLNTAIRTVLDGLPLRYEIQGNTIVITKKEMQSGTPPVTAIPPPVILNGTVVDSAGQPVAGATISIKGKKGGAVTNGEGKFTISVEKNETIVISYVGYDTREIKVGGQSDIVITLKPAPQHLDEMVVVGYGSQRRRDVTGSVSQVSSKQLEDRPVNNIGQALQGLVPNLNVTIADGAPNTVPNLNIRGGSSFYRDNNDKDATTGLGKFKFSNNSPYTLVDGVEMSINLLNPEDIESISVLRDAASSAIYGAKAAFGVLLVTTKKGHKQDRSNIVYSNMFQWNSPTAIPDLLSSTQIQQAVVDAYGIMGQSAPADALTLLDSIKTYASDPIHHNPYYLSNPANPYSQIIWNANVNPYKAAISSSAFSQKHNISLSGGSAKNSYYASLGYLGQDGMYRLNTDKYNRYNFMLNSSSTVTNWFNVDFRSNYSRNTYSRPVNPAGKGGWWRAFSQEPGRNVFMPIMTPSNAPIPNNYTDNIVSFMAYGSSNVDDNSILMLTVSPTIRPAKNWNIKSDISYRYETYRNKTVIPLLKRVETTWDPSQLTTVYTDPSSVYKDVGSLYHYTINAYTDYTLPLGDHHLYGLVGFNQESEQYQDLNATGNSLISASTPVITLTSGQQIPADAEYHWATQGGFYRFTYDYKGKYLLGSNGRIDMTSRFAPGSRSGFFPGVSAGWRVSEENFFKGIDHIVTDLKLRGSYASLGNQNISNYYAYIPQYGTVAQVSELFNGVRPPGITPPGLVSPDLTWETASTLDIGFDMELIKKLNIAFSWYDRNTNNILVAGDKLPATLGTAVPDKNSGTLDTKGFELQLNWKDKTSGGLTYDLTFNLSNYVTRVTKFNGNPNKLLSNLYAGMTSGDIWGFVTAGIFKDQQSIDASPYYKNVNSGKIYPGDVAYKDLDGNDTLSVGSGTLANHGDIKVIGNSTPRFAFSLNSFFSWKGFDLNIYLQGIAKRDVYITDNLFWGAIYGGGIGTEKVYKNSWTPADPNAFYPAYRSVASNVAPMGYAQTRYLQNAAYLRLKTISLGYTVPLEASKKAWIQRLRFSASAYNIWQLSKVPGYFDPEVLSAAYPIQKSVALSVQVTF